MPQPTNTQFAVAVHVVTYLAGAGGRTRPIGASELASSTNVNPVHIRRVLAPLREAGLVASLPGLRGGWVLRRDPAEITLADIWRLIQGDDHVLGLHGPNPDCPVGQQIQHSLLACDRAVAAAVERELAQSTIADLLTKTLNESLAEQP